MKNTILAVGLAACVITFAAVLGAASDEKPDKDSVRDAREQQARLADLEAKLVDSQAKIKSTEAERDKALQDLAAEKKAHADDNAAKDDAYAKMTDDRDAWRDTTFVVNIYSHPNRNRHHASVPGLYIPDTANVKADGNDNYWFNKDDGPHCVYVDRTKRKSKLDP